MRLHFNHSLLNGQGTKRIDILLKNKFDNTQNSLLSLCTEKIHQRVSVRQLFLGMSFKKAQYTFFSWP